MTRQLWKPQIRTKTRRVTAAQNARKQLTAYEHSAEIDESSTRIVNRLLWARAFIDQALAMETRGTFGDVNATALTEFHAERDKQQARLQATT